VTSLLDSEFEEIQVFNDAARRCIAFVVLHDTRPGPAFGGIRRREYSDAESALADALRLAQAMTWKCALAGVPGGGGKAVILERSGMDRAAAYALLGRAVERLGGRFYTGPDAGTQPDDLDIVARHTRYVATPGAAGPGDLAESTALGVHAGIRAVARALGRGSLDGLKVAVQGLGEVGFRLARRLRADGARLAVADVRGDAAERARAELDAEVVDPLHVFDVHADVLAPCAVGEVIDRERAATLPARAVAGAANNVLADAEAGQILFARGVLYAPDFVINAGALVHGALFHLEGASPAAERIVEIGTRVAEVLATARVEHLPPEAVALRLARARHAAAVRGKTRFAGGGEARG
jgi:leucine dehydrogenase